MFGKKIKTNPSENKVTADDFHFDLIDYYFKHKVHRDNFQIINDRIMNDIDFQELFIFIDRTRSKIGQQYLYDQLLTIDEEIDFKEQENLIDFFIENEGKKIKIQLLLSKLKKREAYYISNLFLDGYISKPKWFWVIRMLFAISLIAFIFTFFYAKIFILLFFIYLINMTVYFWNKRNIMMYMDSIPLLLIFCNIAKEINKMEILPKSKPQVFNSIKSILNLKSSIKFFKLNTGVTSEFEAVILFVWENIKILFLLEPLTVFHVLKKLDRKREDIQTLFEYIGKIDSAISIASIRQEAPYYCKPNLSKTVKSFSFTDIYHPLIPNCVPNSLQTNGKSVLLTGSNMSGKTTFIRTVAINVLLAQTINTCFAKDLELPQSRLFSAVRITDDLLNDKSYYFEEVLTIKDMVNESLSESNNIFFLDEIFKGTNTVERIAAGKAVLSYLAKSDNNIVFVSTHDIELADLLNNNYDLYHFTEVIQNEQIHFDYKLKQGNLATKNAIRILEINDYPKEIVEDAKITSHLLMRYTN
ncbi:MAG: DNA mismatch repair protein MutS [Candidatus Azobacteroides sp.]|nr:DNA mismatch repair protein MutS [Candidatus Azobacteroides sp.]